MSDKLKKFAATAYEPLLKYLVTTLCVIGLLLLTIGVLVEQDTWSRLITNVGTAILGGGVFAAILKSAQFTEIFQKHIFEIFFTPYKIESIASIRAKWSELTQSLIKEVLSDDYKQATEAIEKAFLKKELEYHQEEHEMKYEVEDLGNGEVRVTNHSSVYIVPSSRAKKPIFKRYIQENNQIDYKYIAINEVEVPQDSIQSHLAPSDDSEFQTVLQINLSKAGEPLERTKIEMTTSWQQNLSEDPILKGRISRYVKGLTLKVKVPDSIKVHFESLGLDIPSCTLNDSKDGEGFYRCHLSKGDSLLLPGQGYILVLSQELKGAAQ